MPRMLAVIFTVIAACTMRPALAATEVVDIPTRPGVTQRFLFLDVPKPKAAVILFAGGHGGLQLDKDGGMAWGKGNFLVRTAPLFAEHGLAVAVIDAPSDRQRTPYLNHFRQTAEHATDVRAVIAWMKQKTGAPVWLVGTSRGTQSAAYVATQAGSGGPDGLVLTSTILADPRSRPVPDMAWDAVKLPVLVVHHAEDGCSLCRYSDMPRLMSRLGAIPRHELVTIEGGVSVGDPCEARAYHGYNGVEPQVVARIAGWITGQ